MTRANGDTRFEHALDNVPNRKRLWVISSSLLIVLAIAGGAAYWISRDFRRIDHGLRSSGVASVTAPAVIVAVTVTPIKATVSGTIDAVYCEVGEFVKRGQLCAKIDPQPYRLIVEQGMAALGLANSSREQAGARLARAQAAYARNQKRAVRRSTAANVLEVSQRAVELRKARVLREEASVARAKQALRVAQINLENTDIIAPIDGIVASRTVVAGNEVINGVSEPLFTVAADHGAVEIVASVSEAVVDAVRPGDEVLFSLDLMSNQSFHGTVAQLALSRETIDGAKRYDLVVTAPNPDLSLKPGMSATIRMTIGRRDDDKAAR
ncbi:efflux RND transporter periplasmic adaptor subunit [Methylosinus sp. PW1]|uniref:efflux RND transporter periplasmic adaptor subunit n=1 Tax=Methylosinus sp. PW1 TaxID=107636 RepID=UPI001FDA642D|nr:efflux RND transporter periplasmic adaptor subunit [Methylosinus sp. PW1]